MLSPEADLFRRLTRAVFRAHNAVLRHGDLANAPFGQSSARWRLLGLLSGGQGSVADIARDTGYSRQAVQRLADALVAEGLATAEPHPTDGRRQVLALTASGHATLAEMEASYDGWAGALLDAVGADTARDVSDRLDAISGVLERDVDRIRAERDTPDGRPPRDAPRGGDTRDDGDHHDGHDD